MSCWLFFLEVFNGKCMFLEKCSTTDLQTDASKFAASAFYRGDWLYHSFIFDSPSVRDLHINYKEVLAIVYAAKHWCKDWFNKHVIISSDNTTTVSIINKGTCNNPAIMSSLIELFWLSAVYNFRITAKFIPGHENPVANAISRKHDTKYLFRACNFIVSWHRRNPSYLQNCFCCRICLILATFSWLYRHFGNVCC